MFQKFKFERIPLSLINLDLRNPRIVTQQKLAGPTEVISYLFEHEDLGTFLKQIALEGRNPGAERPYVVKVGKEYVVVEGNTRIAAYKILTGQLAAPAQYLSSIPQISKAAQEDLLSVDCSIAPSREALLPLMARAHFGRGDKTQWSYLGSRKAVFEEWKSGKSIAQLAHAFDRKQSAIRDLLLEYKLYLEAISLKWTEAEKAELLSPSVEFNPPVRFLQTSGHKSAVGVTLDKTNLEVQFESAESKRKFQHLVRKLVLSNERGVGATATYADVFADYVSSTSKPKAHATGTRSGAATSDSTDTTSDDNKEDVGETASTDSTNSTTGPKLKTGALFNFDVTTNSLLMKQLIREARDLNTKNFPAAGTSLLRSIMEGILKQIIADQNANPQQKLLSLETSIDISLSNSVNLNKDDKKILKEFKSHHLDYINMGAHATVVPNHTRLMSARDCVAQFVQRNI